MDFEVLFKHYINFKLFLMIWFLAQNLDRRHDVLCNEAKFIEIKQFRVEVGIDALGSGVWTLTPLTDRLLMTLIGL